MSWKQRAEHIYMEARVLYFVLKNPRARWYERLVAACSVGYFFSPIQLIPNFIPVIGLADDVLVLLLGAKLLRKITPPELLAECRDLARLSVLRGRKHSDDSEAQGRIKARPERSEG
jgi:uncharacterized membrane protein YkvA (DUF1232 family)